MDKLLSDSPKTEIPNKVMDILREYHISNRHSEPYHQNQNPAEWRYRTIKSWTNTVMNRSGAPANCWLLCLIYVCYLLNHIYSDPSEDKIISGSPLGPSEGFSLKQKTRTVFIRSRDEENPSGSMPMPTIDPTDLIGRTILLPPLAQSC